MRHACFITPTSDNEKDLEYIASRMEERSLNEGPDLYEVREAAGYARFLSARQRSFTLLRDNNHGSDAVSLRA